MFITDDVKYIGVNDHKVDLFEGQYKVPNGMSYNSYLILDEKTAVMDTVDGNFAGEWLENLEKELNGRTVDYLVVQHMEPDHSANIGVLMAKYPHCRIVGNTKTFKMIENFFSADILNNAVAVNEGDELSLGKHTLKFVFAPMVHWPEVTVTYDVTDKILFSADGFGKFGALDACEEWDGEARRYYYGIVGKYGVQVQALLKKAGGLDIKTVCPLHGPVLTDTVSHAVEKYGMWSTYTPESDGVMIAYTSVYGNTKKAAEILRDALNKKGCAEVVFCDLARCDMSFAVEEAFRLGKLVLASPTYNGDVFPFMKDFLHRLTERNYQKRKIGFIENGSWAPMATKIMKNAFEKSKEITFTETNVTLTSAVKEADIRKINELADEMIEG